MDRFELSGSSPRYAWPVVAAGASAVLAAAGLAGVAHDERLRDEAAALAERLRTVAEKLGAFGPAQHAFQLTFAATEAHAARLLGGGEPGEEPAGLLAAWDEAAAVWTRLAEPYLLGQALLHAAETALACGDRAGAAERLRRAVPLADDLGAHPLAEQITLLARRARIRLTPNGPDSPQAGDDAFEPGDGPGTPGAELGLTERELEVLRLVAAGRSNREIAAELFISPKTASVHVSNILGKLDVASRGEAAARAHALRLFGPAGGPLELSRRR
jgi:DNA-binding CsgD family transcriptional regulator